MFPGVKGAARAVQLSSANVRQAAALGRPVRTAGIFLSPRERGDRLVRGLVYCKYVFSCRARPLLYGDQLSMNTYSCCASRMMSRRLPSWSATTNSKPPREGTIVMKEMVPSSFLRVATGLDHSPKSK